MNKAETKRDNPFRWVEKVRESWPTITSRAKNDARRDRDGQIQKVAEIVKIEKKDNDQNKNGDTENKESVNGSKEEKISTIIKTWVEVSQFMLWRQIV